MSSIERPEGLPSTWTVEVKGSDEEKRECYIDPETGREFHSMLEVSDYLNTTNINKATEKTGENTPSETGNPQNSESADVAEDTSEKKQESNEKNAVPGTQVDGLPEGWIKEVVVRRAKGGTRKDSYYLDPSSDYAFLSKLDALRYLETGGIDKCAIKPKKKSEILMKSVETPTKSKSVGRKSRKKSTSSPTSGGSKRLKTSETVEPEKEEKVEGSVVTEEVKDNVGKSTNDEKTEVPLVPEPVKSVNGDVPTEVPEIPLSVGIEERKNEVVNEVTNL
ncbi:hypothetical protein LXL04_029634 [Taraxacum kok-saghyz]